MKVTVEKLYGEHEQNTPLGRVLETIAVPGVLRVDVHDEALKGPPLNIPAGKLHVGMIGTQDGARFCENYNFYQFSPSQQETIVEEVNRLHGRTSSVAPNRLPEIPPAGEVEDEDDYDDFDTDLE